MPRADVTFRGRLGGKLRQRRFERSFGAGTLTAELRFSGTRPLTLIVLDADEGRALARISGKSPLRLSRAVREGNYDFVVSGSRVKSSFTLGISRQR